MKLGEKLETGTVEKTGTKNSKFSITGTFTGARTLNPEKTGTFPETGTVSTVPDFVNTWTHANPFRHMCVHVLSRGVMWHHAESFTIMQAKPYYKLKNEEMEIQKSVT